MSHAHSSSTILTANDPSASDPTGQRRDEPVGERDDRHAGLASEAIVEHLREDHVRRRGDQRGNASDGRRERDAEEDGLREALHLLLAEALVQRLHQRVAVRHHHQRRRRVAHEDRQHRAGAHDSEQHGARTREEPHDAERDPHVEVPFLHGQRHQEAREEQEDHCIMSTHTASVPSLKYCVETVEAGRMFRNGNRITGSRAVTDSGMISLIHRVANDEARREGTDP